MGNPEAAPWVRAQQPKPGNGGFFHAPLFLPVGGGVLVSFLLNHW